jgi:hypothetical protein
MRVNRPSSFKLDVASHVLNDISKHLAPKVGSAAFISGPAFN